MPVATSWSGVWSGPSVSWVTLVKLLPTPSEPSWEMSGGMHRPAGPPRNPHNRGAFHPGCVYIIAIWSCSVILLRSMLTRPGTGSDGFSHGHRASVAEVD